MKDSAITNDSNVRQTTATGERKRTAILQAVLRIIANEGIRAVRHRAVAAEAGVSLAATTYYFSSLQDLLTESFAYWSIGSGQEVERFRLAAGQLVAEQSRRDGQAISEDLLAAVAELTAQYIEDQVTSGRRDRNVELAFRHEAVRDERLRQLVETQDRLQLQAIVEFNRALGTDDPEADAEISLALLLRLEQQALMRGVDQIGRAHV